MKHTHILLSLALIPLFVGCGGGSALTNLTNSTNDNTSTSSSHSNNSENEGNKGRENGSENEGSENESGHGTSTTRRVHNQGVNCLQCHTSGEHRLISGATVYTTLDAPNNDARKAAQGYRVQLLLQNNQILRYNSSRGTGNSDWTRSITNTNFTAQVIDSQGKVVNQSATNSHDTANRLDCNKCHTSSGLGATPGRIVSYDYTKSLASNTTPTTTTSTTTTPTPTSTTSTTTTANKKSFSKDVMPILNKCTTCHTTTHNAANGGKPYIVTDAAGTYSNLTTNTLIDTVTPANSLLLQKATSTTHGGGQRFTTSSTEYQTISTWITEGALNN